MTEEQMLCRMRLLSWAQVAYYDAQIKRLRWLRRARRMSDERAFNDFARRRAGRSHTRQYRRHMRARGGRR